MRKFKNPIPAKVKKENVDDILSLTPMQEGMLFHYLSDPEGDQYFEQLCLDILGRIDLEPFEKAWQLVVESNEALRSLYRWDNVKKPVQIILKEYIPLVIVYDFSPVLENGCPIVNEKNTREFLNRVWSEEKLEKLQQINDKSAVIEEISSRVKQEDRKNKFDLRDVPFRITLCKFGSENRMFITYHHILFDGWSTGIILKEFLAAYRAAANRRVFDKPVKGKYKTFINRVTQGDKSKEKAFWEAYLGGWQPNPTIRSLQHRSTDKPPIAEFSRELSPKVVGIIRDFVTRENITLASFLYSVWGLLLQWYGNSGDVVFGTTISGRDLAIQGIENSVGLFINTLPARIKANRDKKAVDFLHEIHDSLQERREFETSSLPDIKKYCGMHSLDNLFDTLLIIENYPLDQSLAGGNQKSTREALIKSASNGESNESIFIRSFSMTESTHYDLTVIITVFAGLKINFIYNTGAYDLVSVEYISKYFETMMKGIVDHPGKKIAQIKMADETDCNLILSVFNDTRRDYPSQKSIHELLEEQVERTPDHTALVFEDKQFTYTGLNEKANQLARLLRNKGTKPDHIVGIMVKRSIEMMIGLFAVLKAGGAYLPLDPEFPRARLKYMVENSKTSRILTQKKLPANREFRGELINLEDKYIYPGDNSNLEIINKPSDLAYVIYTSGSTGKPKGVMLTHQNVNNFIKGMIDEIDFSPGKTILSVTTFSFDIFVLETWLPMMKGIKVVIATEEEQKNPDRLGDILTRNNVTMIQTTPSRMRFIIENREPNTKRLNGLLNLTEVMIGGEAFPGDLLEQLKLKTTARIYNMYGPTETAVWSAVKEVTADEKITLGKPIANTQIYIVDKKINLLPIGMVGELYIGGHGVARGYLNETERTREKFIPNPFIPGERMYQSGDLARWLPDGNIEYFGREDYQVKIRGFRIEPEEIETILRKHSGIKDAVVLVKEFSRRDTRLLAYIVKKRKLAVGQLRSFLRKKLPEYMIPSMFEIVKSIPLTPNRKVDRNALLSLTGELMTPGTTFVAPKPGIEKTIADTWIEVLKVPSVGVNDNFFDLGGHSLHTIQVSSLLTRRLGKEVSVVNLFRYTTIRSLAQFLSGQNQDKIITDKDTKHLDKLQEGIRRLKAGPKGGDKGLAIAVIGMAGRFPGASSIDEFWSNLKNGVESISFFTDKELEQAGMDPELIKNSHYVKAKGVLEDIEFFDAGFFSYSSREAQIMDPQLRVLHECTWAALENAGYASETYDGFIGFYAGALSNVYWLNRLYNTITDPTEEWEAENFNINSLTMPISYKLDLKGPSITVETACSTSLVAIHMACQALIIGECDMALAGGCSIAMPKISGYFYQDGMIRSPDGHCRAFDTKAKGTISGDGVGLVVLKRFEETVADGDYIYAVVKGTAINNDGVRKIGYTAPSVEGQAEVIRAAQQIAHIEPETISYIETHGTGTALGDPIEIEALKLAFNTDKKGFCSIGSAKTNLGHLNSAAGVAGFIKTVLSLHDKVIPPSLHFSQPNSKIDFELTPFYVNSTLKELKRQHYPLRAGVSSFGIGGTNAHVVLEEAPGHEAGKTTGSAERETKNRAHEGLKLVVLSARTKEDLERRTSDFVHFLGKNSPFDFDDIVYTLQVGRKSFEHKKAVVCSDGKEAVDLLSNPGSSEPGVRTTASESGKKRVMFMFSGQGSQYVDMGLGLYKSEPLFRQEADKCFKLVQPFVNTNLKSILYPELTGSSASNDQEKDCSHPAGGTGKYNDLINQTEVAQPLLFIIEYALARLLMHWGVQPQALIGHSIGEYTAACLAGVFSLKDALKIVSARGKFMQEMEKGAMLSVRLGREELEPLLRGYEDISLAALNSSSLSVVAGRCASIDEFANLLKGRGYEMTRLQTSHAFHSYMMEPMLNRFHRVLRTIRFNTPALPYISNVTGNWITVEQAADPEYWVNHVRATVRFAQGMSILLNEPDRIFLEIGPGRALSTFVHKHIEKKTTHTIVNTVRHPKEAISDIHYLLDKIGHLWSEGIPIDWDAFYSDEKRKRVPLPVYPFKKEYYWKYGEIRGRGKQERPPSIKKENITDWFYLPSWQETPSPASSGESRDTAVWMLFADRGPLGAALSNHLGKAGNRCIVVHEGNQFTRKRDDEYVINAGSGDDYIRLFQHISSSGTIPAKIVHLWSLSGNRIDSAKTKSSASFWSSTEVSKKAEEIIDRIMNLGFYSLLYLAQAIGRQDMRNTCEVTVFTNHMESLLPDDAVIPLKATLKGAVKVIPQEYPFIAVRSIDITQTNLHEWSSLITPEANSDQCEGTQSGLKGGYQYAGIINTLIAELSENPEAASRDRVTAYRGNKRYVRTYHPVRLHKPEGVSCLLRKGGVYLITGGLGGIGLVLAEYLAKTVAAKLILTTRSAFPDSAQWDNWLSQHSKNDGVSEKIKKIHGLENPGAEIMVCSADITDWAAMKEVASRSVKRFGHIDGVIHCAGVPDAGMIQNRTKEAVEKVLAPKVKGTMILCSLLEDMGEKKPDFIMLCSSINSILGAFGQVGYVSANAFLDTFASANTGEQGVYTISVNWDTWREVGMAVESVDTYSQKLGVTPTRHFPVEHSFLDFMLEEPAPNAQTGKINNKKRIYVSYLSPHKHWALDEHRIMGKAVFPGTGCLEMVRAGFEDYSGSKQLEIKEIYFMAPLVVEDGEEREVRTTFTDGGDFVDFVVMSRPDVFQDTWQEHARGIIAPLAAVNNSKIQLETIKANCPETFDYAGKEYKSHTGLMKYGPRWSIIKQIHYGNDEGLAELELADQFRSDLPALVLHPALMDIASSFMDNKISPNGNYLPFSYKNLQIYAPLQGEICSYVKYKPGNHPDKETLVFSIVITDKQGSQLVGSDEFVLKKVKSKTQDGRQANAGFRTASNRIPNAVNYALEIEKPGELNTLKFKSIERKKLGADEVEIEVFATGLNFKEVLLSLGMLPIPDGVKPVFGLECTGRITAVGEDVKSFKPGDNVIAFASSGFSRFVTTKSSSAALKPANISFEQAATIPIAFMTAYLALVTRGQLGKGERVLIHSAAGGVGLAAVKIAQWIGAEIYTTAGSPEKREFLQSLGIKHVMDSRSLDFADEIKKTTGGRGVDVLLNSLSGEAIWKGLSILAPYGRFLEIGVRDIFNNSQIGMHVFEKGRSFMAINVADDFPGFSDIFRKIIRHINDGDFDTLPYRVFLINHVSAAFQYMAGSRHIGKIILIHKDEKTMKMLNAASSEGTFDEQFLDTGISNEEGVDVFSRILAVPSLGLEKKPNQIIVSTHNFRKRLEKSCESGLQPPHQPNLLPEKQIVKHKRPQLSSQYSPPISDIEKMLAEIIQDFLGIEKVGIHDNFFELGASSIDIIQVNSKINALFKKDYSIVNMYTYPTIYTYAKFITGDTAPPGQEEEEKKAAAQKTKSTQALKKTMKMVAKMKTMSKKGGIP